MFDLYKKNYKDNLSKKVFLLPNEKENKKSYYVYFRLNKYSGFISFIFINEYTDSDVLFSLSIKDNDIKCLSNLLEFDRDKNKITKLLQSNNLFMFSIFGKKLNYSYSAKLFIKDENKLKRKCKEEGKIIILDSLNIYFMNVGEGVIFVVNNSNYNNLILNIEIENYLDFVDEKKTHQIYLMGICEEFKIIESKYKYSDDVSIGMKFKSTYEILN
jgi:hypothetical protein